MPPAVVRAEPVFAGRANEPRRADTASSQTATVPANPLACTLSAAGRTAPAIIACTSTVLTRAVSGAPIHTRIGSCLSQHLQWRAVYTGTHFQTISDILKEVAAITTCPLSTTDALAIRGTHTVPGTATLTTGFFARNASG
eukprot:CAMPEP_0179143742 /NCGR_PEP_ID=MMETSP0796-20121207/69171_1 /TAXON_ID=73915 /ORGANISM="Pyrodinium bahamense, Strain pbaha01" /LENGTH=140 /DNA_ID=CAMNT_0020843831 /DNA_START=1827 /DNA_END=2249 /DNA_ORIENTATION=+